MAPSHKYSREELLALRDSPGCRSLPPGLDADDLRCAGRAPPRGRGRSPLSGQPQRLRCSAPRPPPCPPCCSDLQESCFFDKAPAPDAGIYLGPQRGPGGPGARAPFGAGPVRRAAGAPQRGRGGACMPPASKL